MDTHEKNTDFIHHSAYPTGSPPLEVVSKFWNDLRKILPADELRVINPYALSAGGGEPRSYTVKLVSLLRPALNVVDRVVVLHGKLQEGVKNLLVKAVALVAPDVVPRFERRNDMHSRYLIADRSRVLSIEFSFNRIARVFGIVSLVQDEDDRMAILSELERLDPR